MAELLNLMIFLPCVAAIICLIAPTRQQARWIALLGSLATLVLCIILTIGFDRSQAGPQFVTHVRWIPILNAYYYTGVDGLSLPLALLTAGLVGNLCFLPALLTGPLGGVIAASIRRPTAQVGSNA